MKNPTYLDSRQWIFVRSGLDDFRKGCPPSQGLITHGFEGFLPQIHRKAPQPEGMKRQMTLLQEADLCSKLSPAQQARKAFMAKVEAQLTQDLLTFDQNLGDLSAEVLEALDLNRKLENRWPSFQDITKGEKEPKKFLKKHSAQVCQDLSSSKKTSISHPEELFCKEKTSEMDSVQKDNSVIYENLNREVSDFCNWVTSFGISNINKDYIMKQFHVDYVDKTNSDMLHILKLDQIPPKPKKSIGFTILTDPDFIQRLHSKQKLQNSQSPYKPKWVRMRYGAWYLDTKLWKKQRADEPLVDPKMTCKVQDKKLKKKPQKEKPFEELHGPAAFKEFILRKGYKMPGILEKIKTKKTYRKLTASPIDTLSIKESLEDA